MATTTFSLTNEEAGRLSPASVELAPIERAALSLEAGRNFAEGIELMNRGEAKLAASSFEQALEHAPDFADGHVGLGIAYAIDCRVYRALDHFERAADLDPNNFYAHFKLSQFHFALRVPQKGYAEARRALACAATHEERRLVAQILHEERQREKSMVRRPWWNLPFTRPSLYVGAGLVACVCLLLVLHLR